MPFTTRITVNFGDVDSAGLVYYPNIFHYFHVAMEEFFAATCGVPYHALIQDQRIGFPTVNVETEFFLPLVYGDEAIIEIKILRVGNSSLTLNYEITRSSDSTICARATLVHVCMNLDSKRAVTIPTNLREKLVVEEE
jgi:4-hydroxybenzoyl-CoA thioesterase